MPYTPLSSENKKDEDVGFFESAFAGVATGLWNIPKGFVSLGAELVDLVGNTDTAKGVEEWFDDVNPFDDEAEARSVRKNYTSFNSNRYTCRKRFSNRIWFSR